MVSIDRMVETPRGTYFLGVEVLGFEAKGKILHHYRAPYGKLIEGAINVNCRDRNDSQASYLPEYRAGRPEESAPVIPLKVKHTDLPLFTLQGAAGPVRGLFELWAGRELLEQAGYDPDAASMEILGRLADPFLFLILSLAAVAFGWVYRARYPDSTPFLLYPLAASLPLVLVPITDFIRGAHRAVLGVILINLGFTPALISLAVLDGALIVVSLFVLAGKITENDGGNLSFLSDD